MSQEIEIEFKNLLMSTEFKRLKAALNIKESDFVTQHNDYFDTTDFKLKKQQVGLRIREKSGHFVFTLKEPHELGKLETHQKLTFEEVTSFIQSRQLQDGDVTQRLDKLSVRLDELQHLGRLTTNRAELQKEDGLLVLDHSLYFDQEDFELEGEFTDYALGQQQFVSLLEHYNIPKRDTPNKIVRFYNYKRLKESESRDKYR